MAIKSANSWLSFLVERPGHQYWNSRTLDAYDFVYSFVSKYLPIKNMTPNVISDADNVIGAIQWTAGYASCVNANTNTLTTDTAANLIADLGFTKDNDSFETVIANLSGANALTLAAGVGVTSYGSLTIAASNNVKVRLRRASATTVSMYIL
jgi:hypothetical protein|tara:strand:- start:1138 stop:1593 length:456 start_codon:yes stop_codon:yes gene_type:complete